MIDWNKYNTIVIIGLPATGKSWLADRVPFQFKVYHTDDYMKDFDFEDALYALMDDVKNGPARKVIEGIQGYRLLRKLAQQNMQGPDLIIRCVATPEVRHARYRERGKELNKGFDNMLSKIWIDYLSELKHCRHRPKAITFDTLTGKIINWDNLAL